MGDGEGRTATRRGLPLVGAGATGSHATCRYKCGSACFKEPENRSANETFREVVQHSLSRRGFLKAGAVSLVVASSALRAAPAAATTRGGVTGSPARGGTLSFDPIAPTQADTVVVPDGYASGLLISWGDPVTAGAPAFDFDRQTPAAQSRQFGYNNDFVAYFPLLGGARGSTRGLLAVNHEYTNPELMFRGYDEDDPTRVQVDTQIMAHGMTILEVERDPGGGVVGYRRRSRYNRRITAETPMRLTGPAAGSSWTRTDADPTGRRVAGTLNNCAGGVTPWGTVLTGEENFEQYFGNFGGLAADDPRVPLHERFGLEYPGEGEDAPSDRKWERYHRRFDIGAEPNELFRFGWVVEIDPYDPDFTPRKRTALGRMKHEGATTRLARDGRVAVYMGDDAEFEYVYKFVSAGAYRARDRAHNLDLLDEGTLYVARFNGDGTDDGEYDGTGEWLPLEYGRDPLTQDNGFSSQADVLVKARLAADLVGATKMDRPEDVQPSPVTGAVYVALTNNTLRATVEDGESYPGVDEANPRPSNATGHVVELVEDAGDAGATAFSWRIFMLCGDPDDPSTYFAGYDKDQVSPIAAPDNLAFDGAGNLWIATDGAPDTIGFNDAFHAVPVRGGERGHSRQFLSVPRGAEACGPEFTPDFRSLFCAVQHPGEDSTLSEPLSDWPDRGRPPRPSVVSVWSRSGGRVGS